jgi:hypothetical protein
MIPLVDGFARTEKSKEEAKIAFLQLENFLKNGFLKISF